MQYINILNLDKQIEELVFAKKDIEDKLLKEETISEKMSLQDFIVYLHIEDMIFTYKESIVPFTILEGINDSYIFHTAQADKEITESELMNMFERYMKDIDYDPSKLTKYTKEELINFDFTSSPFFTIKGDFYSVPQNSK